MTIEKNPSKENLKEVSFNRFLEEIPPGKFVTISPFGYYQAPHGHLKFELPQVYLQCTSDFCSGFRFFNSREPEINIQPDKYEHHFISFHCNNCHQNPKIFAVAIKLISDSKEAIAFKYGEYPAFGQPTSAKFLEQLGPDQELFLLGKNCENQGMGLGAYAYYRQVVENQKNHILDNIIEVARKIDSDSKLLNDLEEAKKEKIFTSSIESLNHSLPVVLLIDNHNPLMLLHQALSENIFYKSDQECLSLAMSIRVILTELMGKLAQALNDEAELKKALSNLLNINKTD